MEERRVMSFHLTITLPCVIIYAICRASTNSELELPKPHPDKTAKTL